MIFYDEYQDFNLCFVKDLETYQRWSSANSKQLCTITLKKVRQNIRFELKVVWFEFRSIARKREILTTTPPTLCNNENEDPGKAICIQDLTKVLSNSSDWRNMCRCNKKLTHLKCIGWAAVKELSNASSILSKRRTQRNSRSWKIDEHKICYYRHHLRSRQFDSVRSEFLST